MSDRTLEEALSFAKFIEQGQFSDDAMFSPDFRNEEIVLLANEVKRLQLSSANMQHQLDLKDETIVSLMTELERVRKHLREELWRESANS